MMEVIDMSEYVTEWNGKTFQQALSGDTPVLVDFWATWCGPCRMMAPVVDKVAQEYAGKLRVGKVNVDESPELAEKYMVMNIPTLVLLKGGEQIDRIVGARSPQDLKKWLDQLI